MGEQHHEKKPTGDSGDEVPLTLSVEYAKYFKMPKIGVPKEAVRNVLKRDWMDPAVVDLDPEKPYNAQIKML